MTTSPQLSGLEIMRGIRDGELPPAPIQRLLGFRLVEADPGRIAFVLTPREDHYNPIGSVHGGIAATLLDSAMGAAVHTTRGAGQGYATLEMKVNLVRQVTVETGELRAEGHVVHGGSRVATAEGRLTRVSDGALVAHGSSTCLLL
ncbi:MAG TPA: PaaI family thioesterase [Solirubrobacteraceae bacterium]|jgi:uncharacterized protein (TIGR00369 family)|nr:PaaI family thioesterase [Solirubrobacteraceae bacterium]